MPTQWKRDVLADTHRVEECAILKKHADPLPKREELGVSGRSDVRSVHHDCALVGLEQPNEEFNQY